ALKFQHWSTRTHLPVFALWAVVAGAGLVNLRSGIRNFVVACLFLYGLFLVIGNPSKPVVPLSYLGKRAAAHIPAYLCIPPSAEDNYRNSLSDIYDFTNPAVEGCYPLKNLPDY